MASTITLTSTSAATIDLTSTSVNPDAAPVSTPRQGGFTLRNRWNASNLSSTNKATLNTSDLGAVLASSILAIAAPHFRILEVPPRTMVHGMNIYAVHSETAPNHQFEYSGAAGNSVAFAAVDLTGTALRIYTQAYISASQSSLATHANAVTLGKLELEDPVPASSDTHGGILGSTITASWSSLSVPTTAATMIANDYTASTNAIDAGTWVRPVYFPHGGFIKMRLDDSISATSVGANSLKFSGSLLGVWEVQANCGYVPV